MENEEKKINYYAGRYALLRLADRNDAGCYALLCKAHGRVGKQMEWFALAEVKWITQAVSTASFGGWKSSLTEWKSS